MRSKVFPVALFCFLAACSQPREIRRDDTQVVAQWLISDPPATESRIGIIMGAITSGIENMAMENRVDRACGNVCTLDGNDIGSGTYNLYLYTNNVSATVKLLVELENSGRIRHGLRIGAAKYTDKSHRDWTYQAMYPAWLKTFDVMYRPTSNGSRNSKKSN